MTFSLVASRSPHLCLWFYHLAWWPWYIRVELRDIAARAAEAIESVTAG